MVTMSELETHEQKSCDVSDDKSADSGTESGAYGPYVWRNPDGYTYVTDGRDTVNLARLTAVAEHGLDALDGGNIHCHHRLPAKIDTCETVEPVPVKKHTALHEDNGHGFERPAEVFGRWADNEEKPPTATADPSKTAAEG